jgi:5-methylcytosine-specific restriction endonuclease McrA
MRTYAAWLLHELLPLVGHGQPKITLPTPHDGTYTINVNSSRLECLRRKPACIMCGRAGHIWLLQSHTTEHPHLNLYSVYPVQDEDDELILMTQDHRVPRSKGGKSTQDNLQTMCSYCNNSKGSYSQEEFLKGYHRLGQNQGPSPRLPRYSPPPMFSREELYHGK